MEAIPRSSSKGDHHGHGASDDTDPILHRLKSLVNHVEQSKMGLTVHGGKTLHWWITRIIIINK